MIMIEGAKYDGLGRPIHDRVTAFGSGIDQTIKRISATYNVRGLVELITSHDHATPGSGTVKNEVKLVYNDFNQLIEDWQAHGGAVGGGTPKVQYAYANGSANTIRRTSMTYPDATVLNYDYTVTTMDDKLGRVSKLTQSTTNLVQYTRLGLSRTVEAGYVTQPAAFLTYLKQTGDSAPSAPSGDNPGDDYYGLDRFGRVQDQRWMKGTTDLERVKYGFDRLGNRNWRKNTVAATLQDEHYTYNNLYRVKTLDRGTLNGSYNGISGTPTWEEDWNFDPTGNWRGGSTGYLTKVNGTTTLNQNRTHNVVNEITNITHSVGGDWSVPTHDANGNLSEIPRPLEPDKGYQLHYDAWNRLVEVARLNGTVEFTYRYDGLNRRVTGLIGANTRHYYYSDQWQILEERLNAATSADKRFVWGLRYRDDLVLRDSGGTRHYALHDYFSVTAIVSTAGAVQERYGYDAFGQVRFLNASFGSASSSYAWETLYGAYRYDSESGLYQVRFRYLHPLLGRWTARDPIGERAGLNLYNYVSNNPIKSVDPSGLDSDFDSLFPPGLDRPGHVPRPINAFLPCIEDAIVDAAVDAAWKFLDAVEDANDVAEYVKDHLELDIRGQLGAGSFRPGATLSLDQDGIHPKATIGIGKEWGGGANLSAVLNWKAGSIPSGDYLSAGITFGAGLVFNIQATQSLEDGSVGWKFGIGYGLAASARFSYSLGEKF